MIHNFLIPFLLFGPHPSQDVASEIMSFSQQGPRTVCILSANGAICNVTLRQPAMSGGTITYEVCGTLYMDTPMVSLCPIFYPIDDALIFFLSQKSIYIVRRGSKM